MIILFEISEGIIASPDWSMMTLRQEGGRFLIRLNVPPDFWVEFWSEHSIKHLITLFVTTTPPGCLDLTHLVPITRKDLAP